MGSLLREVLKSICSGNGWTYAVFWKPKQRNPMILAWEEGHFEQGLYPGQFGSATGSRPVLLGEWELSHQRNSESKSSGNDRLGVLFSKMRDQVHVIGKGIVGKVFLTGTHRWVFQDTCMDEGYTSEAVVYGTSFENSAEWYHQFSAGIQTVAIISVSSHGVLQCGSVKRIGESMGFVNLVRNIFMQFGVNSASSLEIMPMVSGQNINLPKFSDVYGDIGSADICHVKMEGPETSLSEIPGKPICQPGSFLSNDLQTCSSLLETLGGAICSNASTVPSVSCSVIPSTEAFGDLFQQKALLPVKPNSLPKDQLEFALTGGTTSAILDPSMQLNQHISQRSAKSCGNVNKLQQQSVPNNIPLLDCTVFPKHEIDENKMLLLPDISSGLVSNRSDIVNSRTGISEPINSDPSVSWKLVHTHQSPFPQSTRIQYADLASVPLSSGDSKELCDFQINSSPPGVPRTSSSVSVIDGHPLAVSTVMPAKVENDLFQAIGLPYNGSRLDKHYPCHGALSNHVANFVQIGSSNDLIPKVNLQPAKTDFDDNLVTVAGSGNSPEKFGCLGEVKLNTSSASLQLPSGNHVLGQLHSDLKNNECQSGCSSIDSQLKHVENTYTRPDFCSCTSDLNIASILKAFGDGHIDNSSFSENRSENLLDAIVSSVRSYSDRSSNLHTSGKAVSTTIGSSHTEATPFELLTVSEKKHEAACVAQHLLNSEMVMPNCCSLSECSVSRTAEGSQTDGASKSQVSMKMESSNLQHDNTLSMHSGRAEESAKGKQKRPKPGESTRPRPKDRQQIQDRVKELREIVPNGAKCSIDALLERTIKHMLFLQSVTKHADKLKQTGESKLISKDGGLLLKDNFEGGATWAFEVGSKSMMLCEERGFFLEIADMIRGMGLTILKGVMETRDDKIWAHFAVEANRDITRMEVFMSLVHLLEQISNSRPPKTMTGGLPTFDSYHRSSIPAAGSMERLQ
ncbi:uncharacterized protein LOC116259581 isoform X2 [Nymphaea colorata]|uniref:uncharacterized protein LOC116259581 isoform X2 n=1 Tax=Nymphaea colorata TaxID=210225 RepID=UPI00129EEBB8|nr:uncharacterized protein LOC116259581 isoform X2 [Nymphaea colorata]